MNKLARGRLLPTIFGRGGNDRVYRKGGKDQLYGAIGMDVLNGGPGADQIYGGDGDRAHGAGGTDLIEVEGDSGAGNDTARVSANDFVDDRQAATLTVNSGLSCERLYVNGT